MHEEIKRFPLEGIITDKLDVVQHKDRMVHFIESDMRERGYVPDLDKEPHYNQSYDAREGHFTFKLSVYGIYVGKEQSWSIAGMMSGNPIQKYTPPHKLKQ
jgi:hypothetical protein